MRERPKLPDADMLSTGEKVSEAAERVYGEIRFKNWPETLVRWLQFKPASRSMEDALKLKPYLEPMDRIKIMDAVDEIVEARSPELMQQDRVNIEARKAGRDARRADSYRAYAVVYESNDLSPDRKKVSPDPQPCPLPLTRPEMLDRHRHDHEASKRKWLKRLEEEGIGKENQGRGLENPGKPTLH